MALAAQQMQRRDGLTDDEWHAAAQAYFDRVTATGDLPHLRQAGNPARWRSDLSEEFDDGLNWLLAGFTESLSREATTTPPHNGPTTD